jgi:hypothetical protein
MTDWYARTDSGPSLETLVREPTPELAARAAALHITEALEYRGGHLEYPCRLIVKEIQCVELGPVYVMSVRNGRHAQQA